MLDSLAKTVLALAIAHAPPGRSAYSYEPLPACGTDALHPACAVAPVCETPAFLCKPPRWSAPRHAWVRTETRSTALCRYASISEGIAATARKLAECRGSNGEPLDSCTPVAWASDTRTFALSLLAIALHESGLREDVQNGVGPTGRGPSGAACLVQVRPRDAVAHATWLTDEQRDRARSSPAELDAFTQSLLGTSPEALERCLEVGGRMLARARKSCEAARVAWDFGMFSMYGSGARCSVPRVANPRKRTLRELMRGQPVLTPQDTAVLDACPRP